MMGSSGIQDIASRGWRREARGEVDANRGEDGERARERAMGERRVRRMRVNDNYNIRVLSTGRGRDRRRTGWGSKQTNSLLVRARRASRRFSSPSRPD